MTKYLCAKIFAFISDYLLHVNSWMWTILRSLAVLPNGPFELYQIILSPAVEEKMFLWVTDCAGHLTSRKFGGRC